MSNLVVFFLFSIALNCQAQFRNPVFNDTQSGYSVGVYGRYQLASNAITSDIIWKAYQGKFIDRDLRARASNRLGKVNSIGIDLDYGIHARHLPDSTKGLGWFVKIADRTHANVSFGKDFFDLAMFGNASFADKTADLSNLKLNFLTYKQWELGVLKRIQKAESSWTIGLGVALLTGNRNLRFSLDKADLYTAPDGSYIDGTVQGDFRTASLASTQFIDANGLGFSSSLTVAFEAKKFGIRIDADDLGFIQWNKNLSSTEIDSVFRFEGVQVNLLGGDGFSNINTDSLINGLITKKEPISYNTVIPGRVRIEGYYNLKDNGFRMYAGIQYRFAPGYMPYGYLGLSSPLPKGFFIDGRFAYGGFGSWNLGLELRKKFANVFEVRIGTNNLEGYVLPMVGTSQSAYLSLAGYF